MIQAVYKCDTCGATLDPYKMILGGFGTSTASSGNPRKITVGTEGVHHFCQLCADKIAAYIRGLSLGAEPASLYKSKLWATHAVVTKLLVDNTQEPKCPLRLLSEWERLRILPGTTVEEYLDKKE